MSKIDKPLSPERKLLELIRKKEPNSQPEIERTKTYKLFLVMVSSKIRTCMADPLVFVEKMFKVLTAFALLWGFWKILYTRSSSRQLNVLGSNERIENFTKPNSLPFEHYSAVIGKKTLFKASQVNVTIADAKPAGTKKKTPEAPPPGPTLSELASNFSLVGIINGEAAILNKKTQATYYLTEGQSIGEIKILKIQGNRVTLGRNGEMLDLAL